MPQREEQHHRCHSARSAHVGKVDGHIEVVVEEGVVLAGVEDLQQGRRGITIVASAEFVDLVDQHHGVVRARYLETLDQLPWHRTHVGSPEQTNTARQAAKQARSEHSGIPKEASAGVGKFSSPARPGRVPPEAYCIIQTLHGQQTIRPIRNKHAFHLSTEKIYMYMPPRASSPGRPAIVSVESRVYTAKSSRCGIGTQS